MNKKNRFILVKDNVPKRTKGLKILKGFVRLVLVGGVCLCALPFIMQGCTTSNEPVISSTAVTDKALEDLVEIEYKVVLGDTKSGIISKLKLDKNQASILPVDIYEGKTYNLRVDPQIAEDYNYKYKIIKRKVFSYELPPGGSLYDIADYAIREYPGVFFEEGEDLNFNKIVSQIAMDNGCTAREFTDGNYVVSLHATQEKIDQLTQDGKLPKLNNGKTLG